MASSMGLLFQESSDRYAGKAAAFRIQWPWCAYACVLFWLCLLIIERHWLGFDVRHCCFSCAGALSVDQSG